MVSTLLFETDHVHPGYYPGKTKKAVHADSLFLSGVDSRQYLLAFLRNSAMLDSASLRPLKYASAIKSIEFMKYE